MSAFVSKIVSLLKYLPMYLFALIAFSCKKDKIDLDTRDIDKSKTYLDNESVNKLRDSIWYYYKTLSLWQDIIPPTKPSDQKKLDEIGFIRNNYTKYFETPINVLNYLKGLTKSKQPIGAKVNDYDWYSIYNDGGSIKNEVKNGVTSGFGMYVIYLRTSTSNNADLYVRNVENGSGASFAGLQRGDRILSINGDTNLDYVYQKQRNFEPLLRYFQEHSIQIKYQRASDGAIVNEALTNNWFVANPISLIKTIQLDNRKVGYLLYSYFSSNYSGLMNAFSRFQQDGINELVIDLRYNEGGDVETAEYIANWLAPASETDKLMYSYTINKTLESWGWAKDGEEFAPVLFNKLGKLSLNRVYFLVSSNTASASELLINSLKPVMDTYMIGTYSLNDNNVEIADRTYGKPVGFFEYRVDNLYVASFKMFNRNNEGNYFEGLMPQVHVWEFANLKNFGDPEEPMLATALRHMQTGSFLNHSLFGANRIQKNHSTNIYSQKLNHHLNSYPGFGMFKFKKADK